MRSGLTAVVKLMCVSVYNLGLGHSPSPTYFCYRLSPYTVVHSVFPGLEREWVNLHMMWLDVRVASVGWHWSKRQSPNLYFTECLWFLNSHIFYRYFLHCFSFYEDCLFSVFIDFPSFVSYHGRWRDILNLSDLKKRCSCFPLGRFF